MSTPMSQVRPNLRLYLANRTWALWTPILILLGVLAVSLAVGTFLGLMFGFPLAEGTKINMSYNGGAVYAMPGFLISVGVLAMNRNFSMALAFGSSRRNFWLGTALGFVITSVTVAAGSLTLLGLELLTNHWFINARAFDVAILGNGNPVQTFVTTFMLSFFSLFLGAFFGTVYRAFGTVWTTVGGVGIGALALGALAVVIWRWPDVEPVVDRWGAWLALAVAVATTALTAGASYVVNRVATV